MRTLPERANLDHLRKQAKDLLRLCRAGEAGALARVAASLPGAARLSRALRLHDAQSCIAREYGFASWAELAEQVEARALARGDRQAVIRRWLGLAYGGDVTGTYAAPRPGLAARLLAESPELLAGDFSIACASGDADAVRRMIAADPAAIHRAGGPLALPPLVAVTHSRLLQLPAFRAGMLACARHLLESGADPNQAIGNRFPPASLAAPDARNMLPALYGAAGVNRDPELTRLLLDAGADPNDNESLYHSLENPECTRLLLDRGARVSGTNAVRRALDMPEATALELLLARGGDPNEPARGGGPTRSWGPPLLRAIAVRCSPRHIAALLAAGADPLARTEAGISAYRLAVQVGLAEVADLLRAAGAAEALTEDEEFVAACARGDAAAARRIQARRPDLPGALPPERLRLLPDTVAWGSAGGSPVAVRAMVALGWPLDARGGDWDATALNHAVFRGDPEMTAFLLGHGASWRETQGFGSDVLGSLSWASVNEPQGAPGDWPGCARALVAHGLPPATRDPADPDRLVIDARSMPFSDAVADVLLAASEAPINAGGGR